MKWNPRERGNSTHRHAPPQAKSTGREAPVQDVFAEAAARLRSARLLRKAHLRRIAADLRNGRAEDAEKALQAYLAVQPNDADALSLAARAADRLGRPGEAVQLLTRCLELAPDFAAARYQLARLLLRLHRYESVLGHAEWLVEADRSNPLFRQLKALVLDAIGEERQSLAVWQELVNENPGHAETWVRYGDAQRAAGLREKSIAAYRSAIACRPSYGLAWWSLANMKTYRFGTDDMAAMQAQLQRADVGGADRINLLFSLGKAHEDMGAYDRSFEAYARGNAARRLQMEYDWNDIASALQKQRAVFTPEFLHSRCGDGCAAPDPIFVVGRPRSGSTLIEQILSSHPAIEGTAELPYMTDIACEHSGSGTDYPASVANLDAAALRSLGEAYLARARIHRKLDRPLFIDKAPANYHHIGLIHLVLPNAKIIDARRNPAACCFSMFKHNYAETNLRLSELGLVYRDYVALLAHFDRVLPGRIHRVIYENMVADPESEIRRLLDYIGLPFEESCLCFHETERAIRTPSSEQVRRPISGDAVDYWRHFEPWLSPLLDSLGSVQTAYPSVPDELR